MKKGLLFVISALLVGCSGDGGNNNDNTSVDGTEATNDTASDDTSTPFDNSPIVVQQTPSNTPTTSSFTSQFETRFDSTKRYHFWDCLARASDDRFLLFLVTSSSNELVALVSVNDDDFVESNWSATASQLTIVPKNDYSNLEFIDYSFSSDVQWSAKVVSGAYSEAVNCSLYDQDNQAVSSGSGGGSTAPQNDPSVIALTKENLINTTNAEGYFNNVWACESNDDEPFIVGYDSDGSMGISVNGRDAVYLDWSIDASVNTIYWHGTSTLEFNGVEFQSKNSHSGYFQGMSKYQCVRE